MLNENVSYGWDICRISWGFVKVLPGFSRTFPIVFKTENFTIFFSYYVNWYSLDLVCRLLEFVITSNYKKTFFPFYILRTVYLRQKSEFFRRNLTMLQTLCTIFDRNNICRYCQNVFASFCYHRCQNTISIISIIC